MSEEFTVTETVSSPQAAKVLWRFFRSLSLLRKVFIPALLLNIAATLIPQFFLWLNGEYSRCRSTEDCTVALDFLGSSLGFSPLLLLILAVVSITLRFLAWATFEIAGNWSCQEIHRSMVQGVAQTRTVFFDENPSGRIINRLVRDYDELRDMGVVRVGDTLNATLEVVAVAALTLLAHPLAAVLIFPTLFVFLFVQQQVAPMVQRAAGIRSVRLGEVLHRETDLVEGARSFLLYGEQSALFERLKRALVDFVQIHLLRARIEAWGRFFTSSVVSIYTAVILVFVAVGIHTSDLSLTVAGVVMTVALRLTSSFDWLAWTTTYIIETAITARRVFDYVDLPDEISTEGAIPIAARGVNAGELLEGDIEFLDYTMSYRPDSPIILNSLSVKIPHGKRTGIIGRTGAGKTSVVQSLYRMVYVRSGDIRIGGRSLYAVDIETVRRHFTVVPQDPYLFEGSVRDTLDREGRLSTAQLDDVLHRVGFPRDLTLHIEEGGKNLSVGERQLLCLARALLSDRRYIIMDEPTSGVDSITDAQIQRLLTEEFAGRTIITIAHRLETLQRYDWIVELRDGKLWRAGPPTEILAGR